MADAHALIPTFKAKKAVKALPVEKRYQWFCITCKIIYGGANYSDMSLPLYSQFSTGKQEYRNCILFAVYMVFQCSVSCTVSQVLDINAVRTGST